jgi:hypothetical protein
VLEKDSSEPFKVDMTTSTETVYDVPEWSVIGADEANNGDVSGSELDHSDNRKPSDLFDFTWPPCHVEVPLAKARRTVNPDWTP